MSEAAKNARRRLLVRIFWAFALVAISVAAIPFFDVGTKKSPTTHGRRIVFDPRVLTLGVPHFFEPAPNRPLIALRANPQQSTSLDNLASDVWDPAIRSEVQETGVYVISALSTGRFGGCRLNHYPQLSSEVEAGGGWQGGYWAAACDASYDYAGRAIKTRRYAKNAYVDKTRSLRAPTVTINDDGTFIIEFDE